MSHIMDSGRRDNRQDERSVDNVKSYSKFHPVEKKAVKTVEYVEIDNSKSKDEMRKEYKQQKHQKQKGKTPTRGGKREHMYNEDDF